MGVKTQCSKEDAEKLTRLYHKYKCTMHHEAYHVLYCNMEAEDAVQQAFLKISHYLDKIDESNPAMTCNFLKVVTRNVAIDMYHKRFYLGNDDDQISSMDESKIHHIISVQQLVVTKDNTERIIKAIMSLPEIYRDLLLLEKVYGFKREESIKLLNSNSETLKKRMLRAKKRLIQALAEEGYNAEE